MSSQDRRPVQFLQNRKRYWRLSWLSLLPALVMLAGITALVYPKGSQWVTQYAQSHIVEDYVNSFAAAEPSAVEQLRQAHEYNDSLQSEAVYLPNTNIPKGRGSGANLRYEDILQTGPDSPMARLQIPKIDLDLPVYHGTSDATLLKGLGHLEGTSLPVGGEGTRSVITGHRGLAEAQMFTRLNEIKNDDLFYIQVMGEVLRYKVISVQVIDPEDTEALRAVPGKDLVTLVTCTPLGINTQRILVTGERSEPSSDAEKAKAAAKPEVPRFPWFAVWYGLGVLGILGYLIWSGLTPIPPLRKKPELLFRRQETIARVMETLRTTEGHLMLPSPRNAGVSTILLDLLPPALEAELVATTGCTPEEAKSMIQIINFDSKEGIKLRKRRVIYKMLRNTEARIIILNGFRIINKPKKLLRKVPNNVRVIMDGHFRPVKVTRVDVYPLSFSEFAADAPTGGLGEGRDLWTLFMEFGGYPGMWQVPANQREETLEKLSKPIRKAWSRRSAKKKGLPRITTEFAGRPFFMDPGIARAVGVEQPEHALWLLFTVLTARGYSPEITDIAQQTLTCVWDGQKTSVVLHDDSVSVDTVTVSGQPESHSLPIWDVLR